MFVVGLGLSLSVFLSMVLFLVLNLVYILSRFSPVFNLGHVFVLVLVAIVLSEMLSVLLLDWFLH